MPDNNKKIFVLDTNILLNSPNALFAFEDNIVIISEAVLEELDSFKKNNDDCGVSARHVIRSLEKLRQQGNLLEGVQVNQYNGQLRIETNHTDIQLPSNWKLEKADHRILQICKYYAEQGYETRLITNDVLLRIKSDIINIKTESFESEQSPEIDLQYTGRCEAYIIDKDFNDFYKNSELLLSSTNLLEYNNLGQSRSFTQPLYPHEFIILKNAAGQTALGKIDSTNKYIKKLQYSNFFPYGLTPKNVAQQFMIEALMSDVPLVILKGPAGTAKTIITIACGLERVIENHEFRKVLVTRPAVALEENLGFLPGTEYEKILPYMRPVFDSLEILVDSDEKERYKDEQTLQSKINYILSQNYIDMQAISFLRGRSISKQYIQLDEAQNMSINQIKTVITRIGEGSKLILCGDPSQIDSPFLDSTNNGLSWVSEKMKGSSYCVQVGIKQSECVRSKLAEDAIMRLS